MKLTANITLDELTKSQVAERKGINNNPNPADRKFKKALAQIYCSQSDHTLINL